MSEGLMSSSVPSIVGGVSQQPAAIRRENQTESQLNAYGTVVDGLRPRRPSFHVAQLLSTAGGADAFWHCIDRDSSERYVSVISGGSIRVFDLVTGTEKTVAFPDGTSYLSAGSPKDTFRALTVADYTFIVNTSKTVAMSSSTTATTNPEALIHVKQGNYGKTYTVTINGTAVGSYTTPDGSNSSHTANIATDYIASALTGGIAASLPTWTVTQYGSAIHVRAPNSTDFSLAVVDGYAGLAMIALKDTTQQFTDLPEYAPEGFVIGIDGERGVKGDTYYLKATKKNANDSMVVWKETIAKGIVYQLDAATMPWQLVRESSGNFTFKKATWGDRLVGDLTTNPTPSFVGRTISNVFFHRNRLGFTASENTIFSRSGEFFTFFRRTVTTLLDDDPIDVASTSVRVSSFKHAVPFNKSLILFAEQGQHELGAQGILTAKTAVIVPTSEYESAKLPSPAATGTSVFFAVEQDGFCQVREYYADGQANNKNSAFLTTEQCPRYIPSGVYRIAASRSEETVAVLTDADPTAIYVYRYFGSPEERAQSAWTRFDMDDSVRHAFFIKADLYIVIEREGGDSLEYIPFASGKVDAGVNYLTRLDRRVSSSALAAPSYDSTADTTTFTLPYNTAETIAVVAWSSTYTGTLKPGQTVTATARSLKTITLKGDHRLTPLFFGMTFQTRIELSAIYPRERKSATKDTKTTISDGRLQLRYLTFLLGDTANLRVEVEPAGRSKRTYVFNGRVIGNPQSIIGAVPLYTGRFKVPIQSKSSTTKITIVHDSHLPMSILSFEWEGLFSIRSTRRP